MPYACQKNKHGVGIDNVVQIPNPIRKNDFQISLPRKNIRKIARRTHELFSWFFEDQRMIRG